MRSGATPAAAGFLSGAAQVLAEQPLDTLKVRLQSRRGAFVGERGPVALLRATVRREGVRALYQGVTPRLCCYSVVKLSLFSMYEALFARWRSPAAAGAVAGGVNTLLSCPQDVLKSQLQVQIAAGRRYVGPLRTARALWAEDGARAFYRGWGPLVCRDVPGYALLYSVFHHTRASGALPVWACGGLSGTAFYLSTLPIDRVKTVLMTRGVGGEAPATGWRCFLDIWAQEGVRGLYRGCTPTVARTFAGQAVGLSTYHWASSWLAA